MTNQIHPAPYLAVLRRAAERVAKWPELYHISGNWGLTELGLKLTAFGDFRTTAHFIGWEAVLTTRDLELSMSYAEHLVTQQIIDESTNLRSPCS